MDMSLSKLQEIVKDREAWHAAAHRVPQRVKHDSESEQQQEITIEISKQVIWDEDYRWYTFLFVHIGYLIFLHWPLFAFLMG